LGVSTEQTPSRLGGDACGLSWLRSKRWSLLLLTEHTRSGRRPKQPPWLLLLLLRLPKKWCGASGGAEHCVWRTDISLAAETTGLHVIETYFLERFALEIMHCRDTDVNELLVLSMVVCGLGRRVVLLPGVHSGALSHATRRRSKPPPTEGRRGRAGISSSSEGGRRRRRTEGAVVACRPEGARIASRAKCAQGGGCSECRRRRSRRSEPRGGTPRRRTEPPRTTKGRLSRRVAVE
jgi:hypothetical protein